MEKKVVLSLSGQQAYMDQDPDEIQLITEGTLKKTSAGWEVCYDESALTGLEGVRTSFLLEGDCITLTRTGKLQSQMIFREGIYHDSLYQMEFGALMMRVCAKQIRWDLSFDGGTVDLYYIIEIENSAAGTVKYHLDVSVA